MAEPTGKGSIILKLLILLLIVVVLAAIVYPQKEWARQAVEQEMCRLHMENIYYSTLQYLKKYKTYQADLDSLLKFMDSDSMLAPPGMFEVEKLTVGDSPKDSFLVGFPDTYHYQILNWETISAETLLVNLVPKERYSIVPQSMMQFTSNDEIMIERRLKNEDDIYILIWGNSLIKYQPIKADSAWIPLKYFAVSENPQDIHTCPTCGLPYQIATNVNLKMKGVIEYKVLRKEGGNVQDSLFLTNVFIQKLKSDAAVEALKVLKADTSLFIKKSEQAKMLITGNLPSDSQKVELDTTLIAQVRDSLLNAAKDSLIAANFNKSLANLKPKSKLLLEQEIVKLISADSVHVWDNPDIIRDLLYTSELDEKAQEFAQREDVRDILKRLDATQNYIIAKIDTVGLTISCPIDSIYINPEQTFLQKIFGVGPAKYHGDIHNGDYSWSEKK